jgi:hypothetical protein
MGSLAKRQAKYYQSKTELQLTQAKIQVELDELKVEMKAKEIEASHQAELREKDNEIASLKHAAEVLKLQLSMARPPAPTFIKVPPEPKK